jgi:hypothetical protein
MPATISRRDPNFRDPNGQQFTDRRLPACCSVLHCILRVRLPCATNITLLSHLQLPADASGRVPAVCETERPVTTFVSPQHLSDYAGMLNHRSFSVACILFILVRYIGLATLIISNTGFFYHGFSKEACDRYYWLVPIFKSAWIVCSLVMNSCSPESVQFFYT